MGKCNRGMIALVVLIGAMARAENQGQNPGISRGNYPDSTLVDVLSQEDIERRQAEELEAKAAERRDELQKRTRETELKVSAHRYNIEGLKMRQETAQREIESLSTEIHDLDGRIENLRGESSSLEASAQKTSDYLDSLKLDLGAKQKTLGESLGALQTARTNAENMIYTKTSEIQRMKNELAQTETRVQEAEANKANLEAEEMKTRTEWMQTKLVVGEKARQKDETLAILKDATEKYENAQKDLNAARVLLAAAEKDRAETAKRVGTDVAKYEKDIALASTRRIAAEAETIRLETEVSKLQSYASRIKTTRDASVDSDIEAGSMVLKTKLAVESARTELNGQMQLADQKSFKAQKAEAQQRGIAAAANAADLFAGARKWVSIGKEGGKCEFRSQADMHSPTNGSLAKGKTILARERNDQPEWVEIVNGSGVLSYAKRDCGKFLN